MDSVSTHSCVGMAEEELGSCNWDEELENIFLTAESVVSGILLASVSGISNLSILVEEIEVFNFVSGIVLKSVYKLEDREFEVTDVFDRFNSEWLAFMSDISGLEDLCI